MTYLSKCRVMYNGMRKAFPGLRIVSEEHEEYDGPVTVPRLHEDALREDVSLKSTNLEKPLLVKRSQVLFRQASWVEI